MFGLSIPVHSITSVLAGGKHPNIVHVLTITEVLSCSLEYYEQVYGLAIPLLIATVV